MAFFQHDRNEVQKMIKEKIEKSEQSLQALRQLPLTSEAGQKDMEERKKKYERALEELEKAVAYYSQFHQSA